MSITEPRQPMRLLDDALICVSVTVAFEAFQYRGHYSHSPDKPGQIDAFSLSYAEYGPKVGIWRVFDALDRHGVKATFDVGGLAAERYPAILGEMHRRGHEVAGHGWANDIFPDDADLEGEERAIADAIAAIERATGARPVGWVSPGSVGTSRTLEHMVREGFLWNGDDASDDMPFIRRVAGKPLVILPRVNFPTNDLIVWLKPQNPPSAFFEGFKETFDYLYEEGRRGDPKWVDLLIHSDMGARPPLMSVFEKALRHAAGFDGVWWSRRRDLAEWALATLS